MRILVVEDEHKIAGSLKKGLEQENYAVDVVYDGISAYDYAVGEPYDLLIVDLMIPGIDGLELTKRLRKENVHTPILILTAKGQTEDKVTGLDTGADDYMTKPFALRELLARIRALIRRPHKTHSSLLAVADLTLDTATFDIKRNGKRIRLSGKEFALLEYLMRHQGTILTKDQIIGHVWNYDADILPNTVEVYIGYLRHKIDKPFGRPNLIHTVRGFGYKVGLEE